MNMIHRVFKENVTDEQMEALKEKIYDGSFTKEDIEKYTRRLGDDIAKVYGWDIPKQRNIKERNER